MKLILLILIFFLSCTKDNSSDSNKSILKVPLGTNVSSLDPAVAFDEVSLRVLYQVYETLYEYDYNSKDLKIIPLLADGMPKISEDKLTYTIKIKKNILYHPHSSLKGTRTVIAQDFINQIKRLAFTATRSQGFWLFEGRIKGIDEFNKNAKKISDIQKLNIEGLKAIDAHTLEIKLIKPYPQIMYALAMVFVTPIPMESILATENNLTDDIIATGPYQITKFKRSHIIKLKRFPKYHQAELAKIQEIEMPFMKEAQTRWLNFRKGNIDFFGLSKDHFNLALDKHAKLRPELKQEGTKLYKSNSLTYWWLSFNMTDDFIKANPYIRKAIAHAINWDKFIEIFTNNTGLKANSIYHPIMNGYGSSEKNFYGYNPAKSMEILKAADHEDGANLPEILYDTRSISKASLQQAEFIKSELKKIGIKIKVQSNTFSAFLKKAREGKLQMWQDGWGLDYPDSENIIQLLLSKNHSPGVNTTYFSSDIVDKAYEELSIIQDGDKKAELMKIIEKEVKSEYTWIMQYYSRGFTLFKSRVKNYKPRSPGYNYYKHLEL